MSNFQNELARSINLSILDFKYKQMENVSDAVPTYKSIHIGF